MAWIVIPNWDKFQHYGERRQPPWIKLYNALLYDDDFQSLTPPERSALISLWMLYATTRRRMRDDTANLSRACGQRITKKTLERLHHAGFIDFVASKPLAHSIEVEVEVDIEESLEVELPNPLTPKQNAEMARRLADTLREVKP